MSLVWHFASCIPGNLNPILNLAHILSKEGNLDGLHPALPLTHAKQNEHMESCNDKSQDLLLYQNTSLTWKGPRNAALDALEG